MQWRGSAFPSELLEEIGHIKHHDHSAFVLHSCGFSGGAIPCARWAEVVT